LIGLLQRVSSASVDVAGNAVGAIDHGLLVLVGVQKGDTEQKADRLLQRLLGYRVFPDEQGKMNLSLKDTCGGLLLVSQFTLAADTRSGMRPGFSRRICRCHWLMTARSPFGWKYELHSRPFSFLENIGPVCSIL